MWMKKNHCDLFNDVLEQFPLQFIKSLQLLSAAGQMCQARAEWHYTADAIKRQEAAALK